MILLDMQQVCVASIAIGVGNGRHVVDVDTANLREMVLATTRKIVTDFRPVYGKLVVAWESDRNWRREFFRYYKAKRQDGRDRANPVIDWKQVFDSIATVRSEFSEFMPYPSISVSGAEADDVIAALAFHRRDGKNLIVSGDGDFKQLQALSGVDQWDHVRKRWVKSDDPIRDLRVKVVKGDPGDGVPNFLSDDDTLVTQGKRNKTITSAKLEDYVNGEPASFCDEHWKRVNWERNDRLVNLSRTPPELVSEILDRYDGAIASLPSKRDTLGYFVKNGLKRMAESLQDF